MKGGLNKLILLALFLILISASASRANAQEPDFSLPELPFDSMGTAKEDIVITKTEQLSFLQPENETTPNDSVDTNRNWWHLLKKRQLSLQDTTVEYPKFLKFCVDVYNWADKFFNGYDPEYVVGTGHRWKARLVTDNWSDSYSMHFRGKKLNMRMLSDLNSNLGAYLHYMAVSVGYSIDMKTIFGGKKTDHSRFDSNFNCALFNFDLTYTKTDGTYIRHLTGYNSNHFFKSEFPGVRMSNLSASLYYFFNHKRYSQGAAYNFSKIQKKSSGSFIVGFNYSNLDLSMDFTTIEEILKPHLILDQDYLKLHYHSYCLIAGYGYNWVFHPKWLFNISVLPSIGFNHCYEDTTDGSGNQFALNIHGRTSLTYNHRSMFVSLIGKISGNWYTSRRLSLFNAIEFFSANVGIRF